MGEEITALALRAGVSLYILGASALLPVGAAAQAPDGGDAGLEEIIVTARKRSEDLQVTPVSVTAFTATALQQRGIETVTDLGQHVANLSIISGQGGGATQTQIAIRGVGQSDFILTSDQSVGLYLDGVYIPRSLGAALDLIDVERIEVLRGPQGTLFGRNTTAGAVQIVSRGPAEEFSGSGELTAGSRDRIDFKGNASIPIVPDRVLSRFSVATLNQDGYGDRLFDADDGSDTDVVAVRGNVRAFVTDELSADLIVDYSRKRGNGGLARLVNIDPANPNLAFYNFFLALQGLPPADRRFITDDVHDTWAGDANRDDNDIFGVTGTLEWRRGDLAVKSITAYRELETFTSYDFDGTPYPLAEQILDFSQDQVSQELQASGTAFDRRLDWIAGFFYFHENAQDTQDVPFYQPVIATGDGGFTRIPGGFSFVSFIDQETESYAGYGQGTWHFTDRLSATVGLRYTYEEKTLDSSLSGAFNRPPGTVSDDWDNLAPRFGLEYQWTPDLLTYFSASRGYRSGGFNGRNTSPFPPQSYDPEKIWAYEGGLKSEFLDRRVRFNGAVFYYDYSDFQGLTLDSFTGITITVGNIAAVEMYGAEFDLTARVTDALQLSAAAGYTHHDITDVDPLAQITIRPDTKLINAPKWTLALAGDYTVPVAGLGELALHFDYNYRSSTEFFLPNFPDEGQAGFGLVNAKATFSPDGQPWQVEVFGSNLANEAYRVFAENGTPLGVPATTAVFGRPREWGVRLRVDF
jgi:iron complex outermembrane receptor protein